MKRSSFGSQEELTSDTNSILLIEDAVKAAHEGKGTQSQVER